MMNAAALSNPFPGLRPFESDESHLFFGREGQSDELLARLRRNRFLAVVGTSGSGKSSLVRAGLLPALHGGFMADGSASWWIACCRPGSDPIGNLSAALAEVPGFAPAGADAAAAVLCIETALRRSGLGLLEAVRHARMPAGQSLLVVADQFEELFRFQESVEPGRRDDAAAFVKLLLEATAQAVVPIYVVLTMRSDYLGDCAQFRDLPERLNDAQYLIPRLTRDQRREAITGPALVGGGRIAPRLVNRLLNDVGDNPDQLPILQHALMRTWDLWAHRGGQGEIDLEEYETVGGMEEALSRHADEAYEELPDPRRREIAGILFKSLTEKGADNREIRRPAHLAELADAAGTTEKEVTAVLEAFRCEGRSFLTPRFDVPLASDSVIDISHESLIRGWRRLKAWVDEEEQSARIYRRVADAAARYTEGEAALWRDPDLAQALQWREKSKPNEAWAGRYQPGFAPAMAFLDASHREHLAEARRREKDRRLKVLILPMAAALLVTAGFATYAVSQGHRVKKLLAESHWLRAVEAEGQGELLKSAHLFGRSAQEGTQASLRRLSARKLHHASQVLLVDQIPVPAAGAAVAFPPRGLRFITYSENGSLRLWDARSGRAVGIPRQHPKVLGAAFSDDGSRVVTWGGETARLWNTPDGSPATAPLQHDRRLVRGGTFSRDGTLVLTWSHPLSSTATGPGTAHLWKTDDGSAAPLPETLRDRKQPIAGAMFGSDRRTLLVWSKTSAQLWDLENRSAAPQVIRQRGGVHGATFSPNGRLLLTWNSESRPQLWKTADGSPKKLPGWGTVRGASFLDDGRILTWSRSGRAHLLNLKDDSSISLRHPDEIWGAELSEDRRSVLTWSADGSARLWDATDGSLKAELFHGKSLVAAKLIGKDRILTWGAEDGARLWHVRSDSVPVRAPSRGKRSTTTLPTRNEAFSPDGRYALKWVDDDAHLFRTEEGTATAASSIKLEQKSVILGALFNHRGDRILTWSRDRSIRLWKLDGKLALPSIRQDGDALGAAFSRKDDLILTWAVDCVELRRTQDGSLVLPPMQTESLVAASFSPAEDAVLTMSKDGALRWNIGGDYDFPRDDWPLLVEVATGTTVDETGQKLALPPGEWKRRQEEYVRVAQEHLRSCQHRDANLYLRQRDLWGEEERATRFAKEDTP